MLYHLTPSWNLESIKKTGIRLVYAAVIPQRIWLASWPAAIRFARHIAGRHYANLSEIVALPVRIRRVGLTTRGSGLYTLARDIPPCQIGAPRFFDQPAT